MFYILALIFDEEISCFFLVIKNELLKQNKKTIGVYSMYYFCLNIEVSFLF